MATDSPSGKPSRSLANFFRASSDPIRASRSSGVMSEASGTLPCESIKSMCDLAKEKRFGKGSGASARVVLGSAETCLIQVFLNGVKTV